MTFGERIKSLREERRMTLEEVGDYLGVKRPTIFKYENGIITNVPSDKIGMLARLFNVSPAYLMGWSEDPHGDNRDQLKKYVGSSSGFVKLVDFMSQEDYMLVLDAFRRAEAKMREAEDGKIHT